MNKQVIIYDEAFNLKVIEGTLVKDFQDLLDKIKTNSNCTFILQEQ